MSLLDDEVSGSNVFLISKNSPPNAESRKKDRKRLQFYYPDAYDAEVSNAHSRQPWNNLPFIHCLLMFDKDDIKTIFMHDLVNKYKVFLLQNFKHVEIKGKKVEQI